MADLIWGTTTCTPRIFSITPFHRILGLAACLVIAEDFCHDSFNVMTSKLWNGEEIGSSILEILKTFPGVRGHSSGGEIMKDKTKWNGI